eukprot:gene33915-41833_t
MSGFGEFLSYTHEYKGEWLEGLKTGQGEHIWLDDVGAVTSTYSGQWKDSLFNGHVDFSGIKGELYRGLDFKRKVSYQFVYNWDKMLMASVVVGAGAAYAVVKANGEK